MKKLLFLLLPLFAFGQDKFGWNDFIETSLLAFLAGGGAYLIIVFLAKIRNSFSAKNLRKKTDSFLHKISNSKQKRIFLENDKNLLFKYNIKETSSKKIKEITALPLSLKEWQVFVTYYYKQNQTISNWMGNPYKTKKVKKGDENTELICTISDAEVERRLKSQKSTA